MRTLDIARTGAVFAAAFALGAVATHLPSLARGPAAKADEIPIRVPDAAVAAAVPTASFAPLVEAVKPAVAVIRVEAERRSPHAEAIPAPFRSFFDDSPQTVRGEGSGFVISADGYMLTNNHVVDGATHIVAGFADGRDVEARVVGTDPATDVALLKLTGDETWPYVSLDTATDPAVGDWVVAVGNPLGLGITVTAGIVSGTGRVLGHDAYDDFIQTDAAINQGNSGGPLFDTRGRVVGMNTAIIQGANTVGFAVPADLISDVLDQLKANGRVSRGYIGVELQSMDADLAAGLGVPDAKGALVARVQPGTPGADAGLQPGDVIVRIGAEGVESTQQLVREVARHAPGEKIDLGVVRGGKPETMKLKLAERPGADTPPDAAPDDGTEHGGKRLGIGLSALPPSAAQALGTSSGVLVASVDPDGPADGKLRRGDVIQQIGDRPVSDPDDIRAALKRIDGPVVLRILRDGAPMFVAITR